MNKHKILQYLFNQIHEIIHYRETSGKKWYDFPKKYSVARLNRLRMEVNKIIKEVN